MCSGDGHNIIYDGYITWAAVDYWYHSYDYKTWQCFSMIIFRLLLYILESFLTETRHIWKRFSHFSANHFNNYQNGKQQQMTKTSFEYVSCNNHTNRRTTRSGFARDLGLRYAAAYFIVCSPVFRIWMSQIICGVPASAFVSIPHSCHSKTTASKHRHGTKDGPKDQGWEYQTYNDNGCLGRCCVFSLVRDRMCMISFTIQFIVCSGWNLAGI